MEQKHANYKLGMTVIGAIFFIFGFATTFIITLSGKVKDIFALTEFKAQLLSFSFFITYLIISIPIGLYIKKIGYKSALIIGLLLMAAGSFLFFPAAKVPSFGLFLTATFILASGVVFLQTAANPYVAALGSEETAGGRLNLVQALNSIATMIAPWLIAVAIFRGTSDMMDAAAKAQTVQMPFILMGIIVFLVAVAIYLTRLPEIGGKVDEQKKSVWKYPHVLLGALGIFFYVGAEVGTGGLILNYLRETVFAGDPNFTAEQASKYVAIYWGGAMVGRFFGSIMLSEISDQTRKYMYVALVLLLAFVSGS
ncbi:MAG TPA: MFS transporter, partial [Bacteroidales bacterium]|nr:MFS transporter [Bacteroidales bacterium]